MANYPPSGAHPSAPDLYEQPQNLYPSLQNVYPPVQYPPAPQAQYSQAPGRDQPIYPQSQAGYIPAPDPVLSNLPQRQGKTAAVVFFILSGVIITLAIVDFNLKRWVRYCSMEAGLNKVYVADNGFSYEHVIDTLCLISFETDACGDMCSNFKKLRNSGKVMLFTGIPSIALLAAAAVWTVVMAFRTARPVGVGCVKMVLILSSLLWITGNFVYIAIYGDINENASEISIQLGLEFCFGIAVLQLVNCGLGLLALIKKEHSFSSLCVWKIAIALVFTAIPATEAYTSVVSSQICYGRTVGIGSQFTHPDVYEQEHSDRRTSTQFSELPVLPQYLASDSEGPKKPFAHLKTFTPSMADESLFGFHKPASQDLRDRRFVHGVLFLQLFLLVTMAVNIILESWVSYCNLGAGMTRYSDDGNLKSYGRYEDQYCGTDQVYSTSGCGSFCSNTNELKHAGRAMLGLGIPAIVFQAMVLLRMFCLLVNPNREFGNIMVRICIALSSILWVVGITIYIVLFARVNKNADESQIEEGLIVGIIIAAWQLAMIGLSNVALSKILRQPTR